MKKLIYQDDASIQHKIAEIESLFPKIKEMNFLFYAFLGPLTTELLKTAISTPSLLKQRYIKAVEADVENLHLTTPTAKANILTGAYEDIEKILAFVKENATEVGAILQYITISNGEPSISESNLESIRDSCRIYITTEIGEKAFQLQCEIAEVFNRFINFSEENLNWKFTSNKAFHNYVKFDPVENKFKPVLYNYDSLIKKPKKHD